MSHRLQVQVIRDLDTSLLHTKVHKDVKPIIASVDCHRRTGIKTPVYEEE